MSDALSDAEIVALAHDWLGLFARPDQRLPDGDWTYWLIKAGRGYGKTRTGAETVREWVRRGERYVNLIGATADDARDIMVQGESGILAVCPPWERPEYRPSQRKLIWPSGAESLIFTADEPERLRGKQHSKLWCFCAGTAIATPLGNRLVETIKVGDLVATRFGVRRVTATGSRLSEVGTVRFSNGSKLVGSGEHPVLTSYGWTRLDQLSIGQFVATDTSAPISASQRNPESGETSTSIDGYGRRLTGLFRLIRKSITGTETRRTTHFPIWNALRTSSTGQFTGLTGVALKRPPANVMSRRNAFGVALACFSRATRKLLSACSAIGSLPTRRVEQSATVSSAEHASSLGAAIFAASVVSTWAPAGSATVYNLTVEGEHEYIANGIIVHNCDELAAWRYADSWDQAKFGLRLGRHPQAVITTTPRPTRLVREIMADPATIVTNGSTYDNRDNLAPSFFSAVLKKYEGTRLGRQEIAGEVLDDNPGALFKRSDIDKARLLRAPELQRIVVAIDPAATSTEGADDTGIVVAGIDGNGYGYILSDLTLHGSPDTWAKAAVKAYHEAKADRIVAEVNNGGEMIESVIRAVDRNVPVRMVRATRGKDIRAEPVAALYEQGRIHHVGEFTKLEDQMTEWDPTDKSAKSPDRMDALVWAISDLMLGDANGASIETLEL